MSFVSKPMQQRGVQDIDFSDRLQRIKRAYENSDPNGQVGWRPDRKSDIFELRTIRYKAKFPNDVTRNISWMCRVAIPKRGMFELDKEGTLDTNNKVKEALVYSITETVDNPNIEEGPISYMSPIGWYQAPLIRYQKHDEFGNGTDPVIDRLKNVFYVEFKPDEIDSILAGFSNDLDHFGACVANEYGERWSKTNAVFNLEEFKNTPSVYDLIDASKNGYLTKDYGGVKDFHDARNESKKSMKPIKVKKPELDR